MPELPEVETMVRGIRPHVTGKVIRNVAACRNRCKPISLQPSLKKLQSRMVGQSILQVRRLGKRVVLVLSDEACVVIEPRMTGLVLLSDPPDVQHLRIQWDFEGAEQFPSMWFWDRRGLGVIRLFEPGQLQQEFNHSKIGPDALEMTLEDWQERCAKTNREIKVVLLDQKVVAGIGNIYASEILHLASINPTQKANTISRKGLERLTHAAQLILLKAIECEGSTLGDGTYRNALNRDGSYQNLHRVYLKEGDLCAACEKGRIVRIVQAQRSTFYCSGCQKSPRQSR